MNCTIVVYNVNREEQKCIMVFRTKIFIVSQGTKCRITNVERAKVEISLRVTSRHVCYANWIVTITSDDSIFFFKEHSAHFRITP